MMGTPAYLGLPPGPVCSIYNIGDHPALPPPSCTTCDTKCSQPTHKNALNYCSKRWQYCWGKRERIEDLQYASVSIYIQHCIPFYNIKMTSSMLKKKEKINLQPYGKKNYLRSPIYGCLLRCVNMSTYAPPHTQAMAAQGPDNVCSSWDGDQDDNRRQELGYPTTPLKVLPH